MAAMGFLASASASAAATIAVTTTADDASFNSGAGNAANCPGSSCGLRDAIAYANANAGTTISIPTGVFALQGVQLTITAPVTIDGQGDGSGGTEITQQATSGARVLEVAPTVAGSVSISDLEITGGNLTALQAVGGGVLVDPTISGVDVSLTGDLVKDNTAIAASPASGSGTSGLPAYGGGIAVYAIPPVSAGLSLSGTTVSDNTAQGADGASAANGGGGNGGDGSGGGIWYGGQGAVSITNGSAVNDNHATGGGGGAAPMADTVGNTGSGEAGGADLVTPGTVAISDSTIDGNVATGGAGANAQTGQTDGPGGRAQGGGAFISSQTSTTLTRVSVDGNKALSGAAGTGGMSAMPYAAIGGGVAAAGTDTVISQSSFTSNMVNGGAGVDSEGGGIEALGPAVIVNTTVTGNQAVGGQGGSHAYAGGIFAMDASLTLASDTLDANSASSYAANLYTSNGSVSIGATIIADPSGAANCFTVTSTPRTDSGGNLEDDAGASCGFSSGSGDVVGSSPDLEALQNNGGTTGTMLPAVGSPALGAGGACKDPSQSGSPPLLVDQRGEPRPGGGPCDIGAVQIQPLAPTGAPSVSPSAPAAGQTLTCNPGSWTGEEISFTYTWLSNGSPIAGQTASTYTSSAEDLGHSISCAVAAHSSYNGTSAGPVGSAGVTVAAGPVPTVAVSSPANGASYTEGETVKAAFACTSPAGGSGIASCVGTVANGAEISTSSLGTHSFTVTATDNGDQVVSKTVSYTVVLGPPPTVAISSPASGASYTQGRVVRAGFTCTSPAGGSGIASCVGTVANGAAISTSPLGKYPFTVTAKDNNGQVVRKTVTYTVVAPTVLSRIKESHKRWRESGQNSKGGPPVGTTFSFTLNVPARVTLTFLRHGKLRGTLTVHGAKGANKVKFTGRLVSGKRLQPGTYTVAIATAGTAGRAAALRFTIVS